MKWFLRLITLFALCTIASAQGFNAFQQTTFTTVTTGQTLVENTVIGFNQLSWTVSGTVSTCTVSLDSSPDGSTWTVGGVITGQMCTSNGNTAVTAGSANFMRVNVTAISGAGATVIVTYKGWVQNPSGGGGTPTTTSPAQPAFLVTNSPYNAKCDGSTDDTTAIAAAITAAGATGKGGTIIIPAGKCIISSALTLGCNGCTLVGQQIDATDPLGLTGSLIVSTSSSANMVNMGPASGTGNAIRIKDISLARTVAATGSSIGINVSSCSVCEITNTEVYDSITGYQVAVGTGGNQLKMERTRAYSTLGNTTNGIVVSGQTNSLRIVDGVVAGLLGFTVTNGLVFSGCPCADTWIYRLETTTTVGTGISVTGAAENLHFISPILDVCAAFCINISSSIGGANGLPNAIEIVDCYCSTKSTTTSDDVRISASEGVQIIGGFFNAETAANGIDILTGSKIIISNARFTNTTGNNVTNGIVGSGLTNSVISGNHFLGAASGTALANGIVLTSTSTGNTITSNSCTGFIASQCLGFDSTSTGNTVSSLVVDTTHITTPIGDNGGNTYVASTLAPGVFGNATSYKATSAITGAIPAKWDTGNANQIVTTVTTDTAAGIPVGVCPNTTNGNNSCFLMTSGTAPLTLGTGTCATIGQFVIVDTTTNGRVKCTGTYTAGTVIGTVQSTQSTVGSNLNVAIGLR